MQAKPVFKITDQIIDLHPVLSTVSERFLVKLSFSQRGHHVQAFPFRSFMKAKPVFKITDQNQALNFYLYIRSLSI